MQDRAEVIAMIKEMGLFANKNYAATRTLEERQEQITGLITTIKQHPAGTPELLAEAQKLKLRMDTYYRQLFGNEEKDKRWFMTEPGINNRLQRASNEPSSAPSAAPTAQPRRQRTNGKSPKPNEKKSKPTSST